jgi:hypothetical protein
MWKKSCRKNEEFENAKEVIEICKSKTDNNTMTKGKMTKGQTTIYKTLHRKLKIE